MSTKCLPKWKPPMFRRPFDRRTAIGERMRRLGVGIVIMAATLPISLVAEDSPSHESTILRLCRINITKWFARCIKGELTQTEWEALVRQCEPLGGIVVVTQLPFKSERVPRMILLSKSIGYPIREKEDPAIDSFTLFPEAYYVNELGELKELARSGNHAPIIGNIAAIKESEDEYEYLDVYQFQGGTGGYYRYAVPDEDLVVSKVRFPGAKEVKMQRDAMNRGEMSEEQFEEWKEEAFRLPDGFRPYEAGFQWTTLSELVKSDTPMWRRSTVPITINELRKLKEETPTLSYEEVVVWCREHGEDNE